VGKRVSSRYSESKVELALAKVQATYRGQMLEVEQTLEEK
jgi:hypothetical protein